MATMATGLLVASAVEEGDCLLLMAYNEQEASPASMVGG